MLLNLDLSIVVDKAKLVLEENLMYRGFKKYQGNTFFQSIPRLMQNKRQVKKFRQVIWLEYFFKLIYKQF